MNAHLCSNKTGEYTAATSRNHGNRIAVAEASGYTQYSSVMSASVLQIVTLDNFVGFNCFAIKKTALQNG